MEAIRQVHAASCRTYGYRRVHAETVLCQGIRVRPSRVRAQRFSTGWSRPLFAPARAG